MTKVDGAKKFGHKVPSSFEGAPGTEKRKGVRGKVVLLMDMYKRNVGKTLLTSMGDEPQYVLPRQEQIWRTYHGFRSQVLVAVSIGLNFFVSAVEKQINPEDGNDTVVQDLFLTFEVFFNIIFTIDLLANLYGNWFMFFWVGPLGYWNTFDFVIVVSSWISLAMDAVPGLGVLRLLRAFRVFRLFKHMESLKLIIEGVLEAIPGVTNAFVILFIFMGIWSIIAVEYFSEAEPQFFGNFLKAMFTMFQILTGDAWNDQITSTLVHKHDYWLAGFFSITFVFIAAIVLSNVVVAILLDKFLSAVQKQEMGKARKKKAAESAKAEKLEAKLRKEYPEVYVEGGAGADEEQMLKMQAEIAKQEQADKDNTLSAKITAGRRAFFKPMDDCLGFIFPDALHRQDEVQAFYDSDKCQIFIGGLIMCNFFVGAVNAYMLPEEKSTAFSIFAAIDYFFVGAFTIELIINMYGNYFLDFFIGDSGGWNMFDFLIVNISLIAIAFPDLPGVSVFRLFRAFRVIRLFKRVDSLKLIVESVLMCMPKVFQTFTILLIVTGVWSILGVEFFRLNSPAEFGSFSKSFLTMWQVLTCDSWASGDKMGRYLIYECNMPMAAIFFITYIFIATIIMSNVVITVLLEGYLKCSEDLKKKKEQERLDEKARDAKSIEMENMDGASTELDDPNDPVMSPTTVQADVGLKSSRTSEGYLATSFDTDLGVIIEALKTDDVRGSLRENQVKSILLTLLKEERAKDKVEKLLHEAIDGQALTGSSLLQALTGKNQ